jgi:hypothetical protein
VSSCPRMVYGLVMLDNSRNLALADAVDSSVGHDAIVVKAQLSERIPRQRRWPPGWSAIQRGAACRGAGRQHMRHDNAVLVPAMIKTRSDSCPAWCGPSFPASRVAV